jgi:dockerin type I repeat protein
MSGTVYYCSNPQSGVGVPGLDIQLNGGTQTTTGSSGQYGITLKGGGYGPVMPFSAGRVPGSLGINTIDVVAVQRHFLVIGPPLSGCRLTAADVNGDASISTTDVLAIQRFFLGLSTGIANVGRYKFNPPNRCFVAQSNQDFDALVFGDVATPFIY